MTEAFLPNIEDTTSQQARGPLALPSFCPLFHDTH